MSLQSRRTLYAVAALLYSLGSVFVMSRILTHGITHSSVYMEYDSGSFIWTNGWAAHAVANLRLPFFSPNIFHPFGVNLLANAYNIGLALVFAPVTWILGPVGAFNLQLLLIPVVNGLAMVAALRRWIRVPVLVLALGGVYAFSPFAIMTLERGWTNIAVLWTLPALGAIFGDLFVFHQRSARRLGIYAAVLVIAQYFISSEMLFITASVIAVAATVLALQNRDSLREHLAGSSRFLLWFGGLSTLVLIWPVYYQVFGPHHMAKWVRPISFFRHQVIPLRGILFGLRGALAPQIIHYHQFNPNFAYMGPTFVALIAIGAYFVRRHPMFWPTAVTGVAALWVARGSGSYFGVQEIIERLPLLRNITITRYFDVVWVAAILLAAMIGEHLYQTLLQRSTRVTAWLVTGAVFVVALAPMAYAVGRTLPIRATLSHGDPALSVILKKPSSSANGRHVILTYPSPESARSMIQQARTNNFSYDIVGGYGPQIYTDPSPNREARLLLLALSYDYSPSPSRERLDTLVQAMKQWKATDYLVPIYLPYVRYALEYSEPSSFIAVLTELLGPPDVVRGEFHWHDVTPSVPTTTLSQSDWSTCVSVKSAVEARQIPTCVLSHITR